MSLGLVPWLQVCKDCDRAAGTLYARTKTTTSLASKVEVLAQRVWNTVISLGDHVTLA